MKTKALIFFFLCVITVFSCNNSGTATRWSKDEPTISDESEYDSNLEDEYDESDLENVDNGYTSRFVKTGDITISTNDIESAKKLVYKFEKECKGFLVTENFNKSDNQAYYEISLSIQAEFFDKFVQKIDSAGLNVISKNLTLEDVNINYTDDSTRLANKKKLEKRYLELLSKTSDMSETLEIEEKLEDIRTDVEVRTSDLKMLERQVVYSEFTIRIENEKSLTFVGRSTFSHRINRALESGWEGIKVFILILMSLWPVYILIAILYFPVKKLIIRIRKNKTKSIQ